MLSPVMKEMPEIKVKPSKPSQPQRQANRMKLQKGLFNDGEARLKVDVYVYDPKEFRYSPLQGQSLIVRCRSQAAAELVVKRVGEVVRGLDGVRVGGNGR